MSDALSDIRKADRNRPIYSEIEYERAIEKAREDERTRLMEFMSICNFDVIEIGVNMGGATHKCERQTCCHPHEPWILCRVKTRPRSEF